MERFADIIDMAQAHVEQETALRIERIRRSAQTGIGSPHCIDCGSEIPAERRKHQPNAVRCVPCQDLRERRQ
jgi:phage/conjugal plasmid C-4 type zinc finger TraR family protein